MQEKYAQSPYLTQAFKPSAWLANIDFIKRLVLLNHLLMVVMSESGGGKSTFVDLMCLKLAPGIQTILLHAEQEEDPGALMLSLSTVLNVPLDVGRTSWANFFEQIEVQKQPLLLMVDDAQHLSFDELSQLALAYKQHGKAKRIFMCLVSDFSLTATLHRLEQAGLQRFIHTIEPGVLTETEAKTYVLRYLQGKKGKEALLAPDRFKSFYSVTQGKIAAMNRYLSTQMASSPDEDRRFAVTLKTPFIWIGLLVCLAAVTYYLGGEGVGMNTKLVEAAPLKSMIPAWNAGVSIAVVAPPPLQKFADVIGGDDPDMSDSLVVMDKVVVIPEQLGSTRT
ncbi:MAG: hypothetical protein NTW08_03440 [Gammaproteobacteria bacterium]|nr:hypothetical protein [Gammaproteobacteria bacterium]